MRGQASKMFLNRFFCRGFPVIAFAPSTKRRLERRFQAENSVIPNPPLRLLQTHSVFFLTNRRAFHPFLQTLIWVGLPNASSLKQSSGFPGREDAIPVSMC